MLMFQFDCIDCGHTWDIIFWEESEGVKTACPHYKSLNVHHFKRIRASDGGGQHETLADEPQPSTHDSHTQHDIAEKFGSGSHATREPATKRLLHLIKSFVKKSKLNGLTG